ncbi:MAG: hypothetical protein JWM85_1550 [Acidimicrobiaceae bacterium]|nr:hypothetical protein [Acidimicrobiaceae bacterium]
MSYPVYGRVQVAEPPSNLAYLHLHDGTTPLKEVDHETPIGVLDQSDLIAQGIHCTHFIPGCKQDPEALGSCTAETFIEAVARKLSGPELFAFCKRLINHPASEAPTTYSSVHGLQRGAISFYHVCTDQTGNAGEEWPPTDCGSSGPYIVDEAKRLGVISGQKIAAGADNIVSLLQTDGIMQGTPFFFAWEEPDTQGFIDGKGRASDLEAAIASGLAGGHETYIAAIEKLTLLATGHVDPFNTVLRVRNHWTPNWGDHGCFRMHLSTLVMLGGNCDFRQLVK